MTDALISQWTPLAQTMFILELWFRQLLRLPLRQAVKHCLDLRPQSGAVELRLVKW